ncbi:dihydroorotase [Sulfuritalea hydrogenivorans]|uniref:Dihydroorotase n=1 Tax=Sulfuritalea hydrogenivorans sk43H TaxID=1223802 RepID=W0SH65_9PROT|nr:dihydroorotase [Sulfuritalea hydrogenivorans]BAO30684.1 dihydroorotase, homodimeric type [Sulfuritalea hydrogenivorans sk43H]
MQTLTITRPDDWHLHLRDGEALAAVLPDTARRFARAVVMPNLKPPVTTVALAAAYRDRILAALPAGMGFTPLMTLYLTDNMPPTEIDAVRASGFVHAIKLYPAGATTNSDAGVSDLKKCAATLARMEKLGVPLLVHGEVTDPAVDIFDREAVFIDTVLKPLLRDFPGLKVVLEHITTRNGIDFVKAGGANVAGTLTAHHLLLNRNAIFAGGIRPHHYCLPVLKRESHRQALVAAAISGNPKFFLGTDSAPHAQSAKETACGCAGCYTAHAGIELYAEAFEAAGALDRLEAFASFFGPDYYGLPRNTEKITLRRDALAVPLSLDYLGGDRLVPLRAGESIAWRLE